MKKKISIVFLVLLLLGIILYLSFNEQSEVVDAQSIDIEKSNIETKESKTSNAEEERKVKVDIKGAVKKPGVYEIESNKRVIDVINLSGGLNSNANTNYINLSSKVTDEMVIWVYTKEEIESLKLEQESTKYMISNCNCPKVDNTTCLNSNDTSNNSEEQNNSTSIININTASKDELMSLDGIGEAKANSIIDYRTENGLFNSTEDIMNVNGIGESLYLKIKEHITV